MHQYPAQIDTYMYEHIHVLHNVHVVHRVSRAFVLSLTLCLRDDALRGASPLLADWDYESFPNVPLLFRDYFTYTHVCD